MTLRVRPGAKNSRTPDHRLLCLTKSSLTLLHRARSRTEANCRSATVDYVLVQLSGHTHREKEIMKNSDGQSLKLSASLAVVMEPETSET